VLLRREGWRINLRKTRRAYRELGLQLCNKPPKRRVKARCRIASDRREQDWCRSARPRAGLRARSRRFHYTIAHEACDDTLSAHDGRTWYRFR